MSPTTRVVIVGASVGGVATALQLREEGFDGEILLIGDERHLPYDRPPLSKQLLAGDFTVDDLALQPAEVYAQQRIELLLGSAATGLDAVVKQVELADGGRVPYDVLVIASGARARRLPNDAGSACWYLRTLDDALAFKAALRPGSHIAIIGAGFIGLEAASVVTGLGCTVEVIEPQPVPLAGPLGAELGARIQALHENTGVRFHLGQTPQRIEVNDDGRTNVVLDDRTVSADHVLVGIGTIPNTEWITDNRIDTSNGVLCDEYCQAANDIYAVGDIARVLDTRTGRHVRVEHRMTPPAHATTVARHIMGVEEAFRGIPYFWSDQPGVRIQMFGRPQPGAESVVAETNDDGARFVVHFVRDGQIEGVLGWNAAKLLAKHRGLLVNQDATVH